VCVSTIRESLLVFRKNRYLFLELLASIGITDIVVRKKMGGGIWRWWSRRRWWWSRGGGQGKFAKEQIAKEKRKALDVKSAGKQERSTAIRAERVPIFSNP
jgi:hypothetical protein